MISNTPTTLALDTTSQGFAFAVLQGSETLLDWACSEVQKTKPEAWRQRVDKLIARYEPELMVLPDAEDSRRGRWVRKFTAAMESLAHKKSIPIRRVSRREVQEMFADSGTTKYEIAVAIARLFPELEPRLPRKRKPWMSEDKRMSIFDAVSFALVALRHAKHQPAAHAQTE
jgi:hypothetical protein